jgi:YidC/Oxa1 family membrane protein insertase
MIRKNSIVLYSIFFIFIIFLLQILPTEKNQNLLNHNSFQRNKSYFPIKNRKITLIKNKKNYTKYQNKRNLISYKISKDKFNKNLNLSFFKKNLKNENIIKNKFLKLEFGRLGLIKKILLKKYFILKKTKNSFVQFQNFFDRNFFDLFQLDFKNYRNRKYSDKKMNIFTIKNCNLVFKKNINDSKILMHFKTSTLKEFLFNKLYFINKYKNYKFNWFSNKNINNQSFYVINQKMLIENLKDSYSTFESIFLNTKLKIIDSINNKDYKKSDFGFYNGKKLKIFDKNKNKTVFSKINQSLNLKDKKNSSFELKKYNNCRWIFFKTQFFSYISKIRYKTSKLLVFKKNNDEFLGFQLGKIIFKPREIKNFSIEHYVGPKDYFELKHLKDDQIFIMELGLFKNVTKFILILMNNFKKIIPNYGLNIIFMTILIKIIFWPISKIAMQSSYKMKRIQKSVNQIKKRFKNNPKKIRLETIKIFRENKINPIFSFFPIFLQIPIFISLFWIFKNSPDLRLEKFLWIKDLSSSDKFYTINKFLNINLLPIIMGITLIIQNKTNITENKTKQFKFYNLKNIIFFYGIPTVFIVICYNFPSGLLLYWITQNVMTIVQQVIFFKKKFFLIEKK